MSPTDDWEPLDKTQGWKWWDRSTDRWWQGTQWADTYRTYDEPRKQENPSTIGLPINVDSVEMLPDGGYIVTGRLRNGTSIEDLHKELGIGSDYPNLSIYGGQGLYNNKKESE